jgi:hypothetical protein
MAAKDFAKTLTNFWQNTERHVTEYAIIGIHSTLTPNSS